MLSGNNASASPACGCPALCRCLSLCCRPCAPPAKTVALRGAVTGLPAVSGVHIYYEIDGINDTTVTDAEGIYTIRAPAGASVLILPSAADGYEVLPGRHQIEAASADRSDLNFVYTPAALPAEFTLARAVETLPAYMRPPNSWPRAGGTGPALYMLDKIRVFISPAPLSVKWAPGLHDAAFFAGGGGADITAVYENGIPAGENGMYTVYTRRSDGFEGVAALHVENLRDGTEERPYLLLDFGTAAGQETELPGVGQFTLNFMQGGEEKLGAWYELYETIHMHGREWEPLGLTGAAYPHPILAGFHGGLDGTGNAVEGLSLGSTASTDGQGFFRALSDGAYIRNLRLTGCDVISAAASAAFAARADCTGGGEITLENLAFSGSVRTGAYAGGILGMSQNNNGTIRIVGCAVDAVITCAEVGGGVLGYSRVSEGGTLSVTGCAAAGSVTTLGDTAAGIVAQCANNGGLCAIENCANAMTPRNDAYRAGGMLASALGTGVFRIASCHNAGDCTAGSGAGGMCGEYNGSGIGGMSVVNCYNTGAMRITLGSASDLSGAGGILGRIAGLCDIRSCYSIGDVVAAEGIPSLFGPAAAGGISGNYGVIQGCAALCGLVSGQTDAARIAPVTTKASASQLAANAAYEGTTVLVNGAPRSPADDGADRPDGEGMPLSAFTARTLYQSGLGWDFTTVWQFGNEAYPLPVLRGIPMALQPSAFPF